MTVWSTGSISTHVGAIVGWTNIPTGLSGTVMNNMVEQEVNFAEQYTTDSIGTSAIAAKYQPAIIDLTLSKVLFALDAQDGGIETVTLGDLHVGQGGGGGGGNTQIANQLRKDAILRLKELQRTVRFTRVIGC